LRCLDSYAFIHTVGLAAVPQPAVMVHVAAPGKALRGCDRLTSTATSTCRIGGYRFL